MTNKLIIERYQDYVNRRVPILQVQSKDRTYGGIRIGLTPLFLQLYSTSNHLAKQFPHGKDCREYIPQIMSLQAGKTPAYHQQGKQKYRYSSLAASIQA